MSLKPPKRKGCLIALLVLILFSALLYTHCAFAPTGYQKIVESNRPARERLWNKRFAPPSPDTTQTAPQPNTTSEPEETTENIAMTAEEYFRSNPQDGLYRLSEKYQTFFRWNPATFVWNVGASTSGTIVCRSDSYPNVIQKTSPSISAFFDFEKEGAQSYTAYLENVLTGEYFSEYNQRVPSEENDPNETGKWMDWTEKILSEERWDRADFFDLTRLNDYEDAQRILSSEKSCLSLYRILRRGDRDKAARLIERYVQLTGKTLFVELNDPLLRDGSRKQNRIIPLERFLFELALEPQAPEAMLERIATILNSWKLDPQEYLDLQQASINRWHDLWVAFLENSFEPENDPYWISHRGWTAVPLKAIENVGMSVFKPILWRAIDRQTEAFIRQDPLGYQTSQWQIGMVERPIRYLRMGHPVTGILLNIEHSFLSSPPEAFNQEIETLQFVFAAARYHRDCGRYPDSVRDLIPRYLDESFASSPDREMAVERIAPFDLIVLPEFPSIFTHALFAYRNDPRNGSCVISSLGPCGSVWEFSPPLKWTFHPELQQSEIRQKWPTSVEDLKPYARPGEDLTPYAGCFVHFDEFPLFCVLFPVKRQNVPNSGETDELQKYFRIHAMFPPLNLDGVPGYLPTEPKERKGPEE